MMERLIAESTDCDFKVMLETKKSKSWLKSTSAFANGIGGILFFGVRDNREVADLHLKAALEFSSENIPCLLFP